MATRKEILTRRAEQIKAYLEEWAKHNINLYPGEFINLVLKMEEKPVVVIKQVRPRRPKVKVTDEIVAEEDWKVILSLSFTEREKIILAFFKEQENKPVSIERLDKLLSSKGNLGTFEDQHMSALNRLFSDSETKYRLRTVNRKIPYEAKKNRRLRVVIVE